MQQVSNVQVYGIIILIIGVALRYYINRRRFNRKNGAAVEMFRNFEHKSFVRSLEGVFRLIATLLIIVGFLLIAVECYNRKDLDTSKHQDVSVPSYSK